MRGGPSLKLLAVFIGIAIGLTATLAVAQSQPDLSPRDFDLTCAVVASAEIRASQNEENISRRDTAVTIFTFYLGRLSGRDDSKDWNAIVKSRIAELQEAVRSPKMVDTCFGLLHFENKVSATRQHGINPRASLPHQLRQLRHVGRDPPRLADPLKAQLCAVRHIGHRPVRVCL